MNPQALGPLYAVLFGTTNLVTGLMTPWISHHFQLRRERKQWIRQQEAEERKWLREELQTIYKNCIRYLTLVNCGVPIGEIAQEIKWHTEAQECLTMLLSHHPARDTPTFDAFRKDVASFSEKSYGFEVKQEAGTLKEQIVNLMAQDPRLH